MTQNNQDMSGDVHVTSSITGPSNNENTATFSPLDSYGISANDIYESEASYSISSNISQSQEHEDTEANNSSSMPTPIDLSKNELRRSTSIADVERKGMMSNANASIIISGT